MSLLNSVKSLLTSKQQTAWTRYIELLERADNPHDGDAAVLSQLMAELRISYEQAERDAATVRTIAALSPHIIQSRERQTKRSATATAAREHTAETERLVLEIRAEREGMNMQLHRDAQLALGECEESLDARRRIVAMLAEYKRLYPHNPLGKYLNL